MKNVLHCNSCSLRVRVTNRAAIALYSRVLGYEILDTDKGYYADGEDAYDMKLTFDQSEREAAESTADESESHGSQTHQHVHGGGCCGGNDHGHGHEEPAKAGKKKKVRGKVIEEEVKVEEVPVVDAEESKKIAEANAAKNKKKKDNKKAKKAAEKE